MGTKNNIPMVYNTVAPTRGISWREKYGIDSKHNVFFLEWAGLDWEVKDSPLIPVAPGDNFFSQFSVEKIFLVMLQLSIQRRYQRWLCSEIRTNLGFRFGIFQWEIICNIESLDPNVLFSVALVPGDYNTGPPGTNEIGIKLCKNGRVGGPNLHFGLLPPTLNNFKGAPEQRSMIVTGSADYCTLRIIWTPTFVRFQFQDGPYLQQQRQAMCWTTSVPQWMIPTKSLKIKMGLSVLKGALGTLNGEQWQVIVKGFSYRPFQIDPQSMLVK